MIRVNNIGLLYFKQGDYDKALEWYQKALVLSERVSGIDHPDTGASYNNIGWVFNAQGDYNNALTWFLKAYKICLSKLGLMHPTTTLVKGNVQLAYEQTRNPLPFEEWLKSIE